MARVFLLIILVWALIAVLKRVATSSRSAQKAKPSENIVQCTQCGLRIPESESKVVNGRVFCNSPECHPPA